MKTSKLIKAIVLIGMLSGIILLFPSCMVGFRSQGHGRHGETTTEHRHDGDRHGDNDHHDNNNDHGHDDHHDN